MNLERKFSANAADMHFKVELFSKSRWRQVDKNSELRISRSSLKSKMPFKTEEPQNLPEERRTGGGCKSGRKAEAAKKESKTRKKNSTERASRKKARNKQQICQKAENFREKEDSVQKIRWTDLRWI